METTKQKRPQQAKESGRKRRYIMQFGFPRRRALPEDR